MESLEKKVLIDREQDFEKNNLPNSFDVFNFL